MLGRRNAVVGNPADPKTGVRATGLYSSVRPRASATSQHRPGPVAEVLQGQDLECDATAQPFIAFSMWSIACACSRCGLNRITSESLTARTLWPGGQ